MKIITKFKYDKKKGLRMSEKYDPKKKAYFHDVFSHVTGGHLVADCLNDTYDYWRPFHCGGCMGFADYCESVAMKKDDFLDHVYEFYSMEICNIERMISQEARDRDECYCMRRNEPKDSKDYDWLDQRWKDHRRNIQQLQAYSDILSQMRARVISIMDKKMKEA